MLPQEEAREESNTHLSGKSLPTRYQRSPQICHWKYDRKQELSVLMSSCQHLATCGKLAVIRMLLAVLLLTLAVTVTAYGLSPLDVHASSQGNDYPAPPVLATSAYLLDANTGAALYTSNPFMHIPMLSTTKLMTALVAVQIGDVNQSMLVNDAIANQISQIAPYSTMMGIKRGETYTLKDLLYGMLLVSGNDAAVVIANQLGGSQQKFVDKMNQKAVQLGLHDTHYMNSHGLLAAGQFSCAHDLAILAKYSLSVPLIHTISSTKEYDIPKNNNHDEHKLANVNQFLWWYPGADGGKTGWDAATNFVQVSSAVRDNRHLIGVVMHTVDWWTDMRDLMNWGFNTFNWVSPRNTYNASNPIPFAADWHYFNKDKQERTIPTPDHGRYYIYTGYSISGVIMDYFDKNGGLNTFGYPTSQAKVLTVPAVTLVYQQFEHGTVYCNQQTKQCSEV